jgi:predicted PurR-regulated permease PerM
MSKSHETSGADTSQGPSIDRIHKRFLLFVVATITVLFLVMVRQFLVAVIMAGVFAGMSRRPFVALTGWTGGRERLAALLTVLGLLLLIVVPAGGFLALVLSQAVEVAEAAGPWLREQAGQWETLIDRVNQIPLVGPILPDQAAILSGLQNFAGRAGSLLVNHLSAATTGTVALVLQLFVTLYAVYFFLRDGPAILSRILYFTPLDEASERKLVGRFVSVTRATIKGSILVGLIQGALAGAAFFGVGAGGGDPDVYRPRGRGAGPGDLGARGGGDGRQLPSAEVRGAGHQDA